MGFRSNTACPGLIWSHVLAALFRVFVCEGLPRKNAKIAPGSAIATNFLWIRIFGSTVHLVVFWTNCNAATDSGTIVIWGYGAKWWLFYRTVNFRSAFCRLHHLL